MKPSDKTATHDNSVLVVIFDGLDYELLQEFQLENLMQKESGSIDNDTDVEIRSTDELHASLITGENSDVHGIVGTHSQTPEITRKVNEFFRNQYLIKNLRGYNTFRNFVDKALSFVFPQDSTARARKEDLQCETIFDRLENTRSINIPSYNPPKFFDMNVQGNLLNAGYGKEEILEWEIKHIFQPNYEKLLSELESNYTGVRQLCMTHFHSPDREQHMYGDKDIGNFDRQKLFKTYKFLDKKAEEIKSKSIEAGYDYVIFLSDHGLPSMNSHNKEAFYSCNRKLFKEKEPYITDFYGKIINLAKSKNSKGAKIEK